MPLPLFFRAVDTGKSFLNKNGGDSSSAGGVAVHPQSKWLYVNNVTHYRLIPGFFPKGMGYHFDGELTPQVAH